MLVRRRSILFLFIPLVFILSSCLKNEVDDLEQRLNEIETALGTNEPIVMNFSTTTLNGDAIEKNTAFLFKLSDYYGNYMWDNGDDTYEVYFYRGLTVDFDEYVEIYFEYDANTSTASDVYAYMRWRDEFGNLVNPTFQENQAGNTLEFKINTINIENGRVSVTLNVETDATAANNEYANQPMKCKLEFNGKLGLFK